jgi:hypothetical protein
MVNKDVATKLRKLDHSLGGYARGCVGPLEQRLDDLGGATPLVCGAFGGINKAWHYLQKKIAAARAQKVWRELLCPSVSQARGVLLQHMQHAKAHNVFRYGWCSLASEARPNQCARVWGGRRAH